jgi:preprotein translocase SecE subunit
VSAITRFFQEAWQELRKVSWPTPDQARNLTIIVLVVSAAVGFYITFFDYIFGLMVRAINAG